LGKLVTLSVDLILTFVLSVYLLVYARDIGDLVRRWMPPGDGTPRTDTAADPAGCLQLRPRPAVVQPDHGRQRRAVDGDHGAGSPLR